MFRALSSKAILGGIVRASVYILSGLSVQFGMLSAAYADVDVPSRTINLVYDDSGSMSNLNTIQSPVCVDTWSQARYAMEIVAAMLDEQDELNIYYMSDYEGGMDRPPRLRLHGSKEAKHVERNVEMIHTTLTRAGETPFNAVRKAYADLKLSQADENWLVVLTDGEFQGVKGRIEDEFYSYTRDKRVKVLMLAMGELASQVASDESRGVYFEHAVTSKQIRSKLTKLTNQIFQRNALPSKDTRNVTFDVPMRQLIVFAQGKDVTINGISTAGKTTKPTANVQAKYATQAAEPRPTCNVYDDSLNGKVATFDGDFDAGDYTLDISGSADSIEVYYKPNVDVRMYFYDGVGNDVTDKAKLSNGKYRVEFGFVKAGTTTKVEDSELLGDPEFSGRVVNNSEAPVEVHAGDVITIREGTLNGEFDATFLKYNHVHTSLEPRSIFFTNELVWNVEGPEKGYILAKEGFSNGSEAIKAHVRMKSDVDGQLMELSEAQWQALKVPDVVGVQPKVAESVEAEQKSVLKKRKKAKKVEVPEVDITYRAEKGNRVGDILIYPTVTLADPMKLCAKDSNYLSIAMDSMGGEDLCADDKFIYRGCTEFAIGESTAYGCSEDAQLKVSSSLGWLDYIKEIWQEIVMVLIGLFLIFGWIKKDYMPKINKNITINMKAKSFSVRDQKATATYKSDFLLNLLPYRSSTGTVIANKGFQDSRVKRTFKLKAAGGNCVFIENIRDFSKTKEISFNGKQAPDNEPELKKIEKRGFKVSNSGNFEVKTKNFTYTWSLYSKNNRT